MNRTAMLFNQRFTDMETNKTLADELPADMARVREVLGYFREIGPAGALGAVFIESDLRTADAAVMSGDVVAMLRALKTLQSIKA